MADRAIEEDEEWYKATCIIKFSGGNQGDSKTFTVNSDSNDGDVSKV